MQVDLELTETFLNFPQGKYEEAEFFYRRAVDITQSDLDADNSEYVSKLNDLVGSLEKQVRSEAFVGGFGTCIDEMRCLQLDSWCCHPA